MFGKVRVVGEPRVEEVGDDLAGDIIVGVVVLIVVLLFVEAESERVGGFIIGVERVDEVLTPARTVSPSA